VEAIQQRVGRFRARRHGLLCPFVESVKRKAPPPLDVYDAAAWSVITPLSEQSITEGGEPKAFPDFTKGRWIRRKPVFGFGDEY